MSGLRRAVPSLGALATFEAAARLESFTLAATELGVTQAAVSRQIKLLETDLHCALFLRAHRRVVLTPAGAALAAAVTGAFGRMADAIEAIRETAAPHSLTIGTSLAVSHFWLMPRLAAFRALFPEVKLKLVAEDGPSDLRRDRLDVAIRYGIAPFVDAVSLASCRDAVFPVASPKLLERFGARAETVDPATLPLIAADMITPSWLSWRGFARGAGLGPDLGRASDLSRLRFTHYADAIEAALAGEGVALGWQMLLGDALAEGRLVRLGTAGLCPPESYHLLVPIGADPGPEARGFIEWIRACFADTHNES